MIVPDNSQSNSVKTDHQDPQNQADKSCGGKGIVEPQPNWIQAEFGHKTGSIHDWNADREGQG